MFLTPRLIFFLSHCPHNVNQSHKLEHSVALVPHQECFACRDTSSGLQLGQESPGKEIWPGPAHGSVWQAPWGAVFGLASCTVCTNEQEEGVALALMKFADAGETCCKHQWVWVTRRVEERQWAVPAARSG